MSSLPVPRPGRWGLLLTPRALRSAVLLFVVRLAERGPLVVLDGGNQFNAYTIARAARGRPEILERIKVMRAFTCYQMKAMLENLTAGRASILALDFLSTFHDESVPFADRRRLVDLCLRDIDRLCQSAALVVSVHPPRLASPQASLLLEHLQAAAGEVWIPELPSPVPEPPRLF